MTEKFYCVGCKEHYQLPVTEAVKKPSKGDSFRHSVVSSCPKGHKTTKICNKDDYDKYSSSKAAESPLTSGPSPAGGPADITPAGPSATPLERTDAGVPSDFESETFTGAEVIPEGPSSEPVDEGESFEATQVVGTMSPGAGINAALEPLQGGLENGDEPSLVPADSFQPNGNGHVIGQETDSYNTTPMHAEDDFEPYFELCIISNGTVGDIVGDYDESESEKAFKEWENHVNEDGPHVLIFYDTASDGGVIVAGDDFMDNYDSESESTGSRKAIMATAAAALVLGLVWYRSSRN
jgi:hypothetical protein|tara:strand:+ start:1234 stop:2118 length:885 start_codon:yes stop_codon:yes gene_type:complete